MIQLHIAKGCSPTGAVLARLLKEAGVVLTNNPAQANGHVCWGSGGSIPPDKPSLNRGCSARNKLEELQVLHKAGVRVPLHGTVIPPFRAAAFPVLARKLKHKGGRDILYCKSPLRCRRALARGREFFTSYIPSRTEYRVWIYRGRHLGTYEKVLTQPWRKKRLVGRGYRNGYTTRLLETANVPREAVDLGAKAQAALGLDFGAVDILRGRDGAFYVLEVNSAPGAEDASQFAIKALAAKIAKWETLKYRPRREETDAE